MGLRRRRRLLPFEPRSANGRKMLDAIDSLRGRRHVRDTATGDQIATLFDWAGMRIVTYDDPKCDSSGFVAIDPETQIEVEGAWTSELATSETLCWTMMHVMGIGMPPTLGDFQSCCSLVEIIPDGPLVGYGYCVRCRAWEGGFLLPGTYEPTQHPWPHGSEFKISPGRNHHLFVTLPSGLTVVGSSASSLAVAENKAFKTYLNREAE